MTATLTPVAPLTGADRCDRCGAQAFVRVRLLSGGELLFCGHHFRKHGDAVRPIAAEILDETARLEEPQGAPTGLPGN